MSGRSKRVGAWGEQVAADYLVGQGYFIVARNVRTPHGEIDIVARLADLTAFVEVKTRRSRAMGMPEESINARKRAHMVAAAAHYAAEYQIDHWRLDAISIEVRPGSAPLITYFENAVSE